jgi:hypothetical protein
MAPNSASEGLSEGTSSLAGHGWKWNLGTLTAVGLICAVLAVKVTITTPQLEGTVPISTGELIGLAGLGGPCVEQAGFTVALH